MAGNMRRRIALPHRVRSTIGAVVPVPIRVIPMVSRVSGLPFAGVPFVADRTVRPAVPLCPCQHGIWRRAERRIEDAHHFVGDCLAVLSANDLLEGVPKRGAILVARVRVSGLGLGGRLPLWVDHRAILDSYSSARLRAMSTMSQPIPRAVCSPISRSWSY